MKTERTNLPPDELKELRDAAYAARERVSEYTDEQRAELEESARARSKHACAKVRCS
jgi:hypothetical protein